MSTLQNQLKSLSELDDLIQFATKTETVGDYGFAQTGIVASGTDVWAKVRYESTNEADSEADQEKFTVQIKIWIRYDSTVTQYKYVYWNEKYFDIYAFEETPRDRFTIIKARLIET
jgi:SPP1 family predicted phage head-tail adaptor